MQQEYLTIQNVADLMGVTRGTIYAWIDKGLKRTPYVKGIKKSYIRRSDLDEFLERGEEQC